MLSSCCLKCELIDKYNVNSLFDNDAVFLLILNCLNFHWVPSLIFNMIKLNVLTFKTINNNIVLNPNRKSKSWVVIRHIFNSSTMGFGSGTHLHHWMVQFIFRSRVKKFELKSGTKDHWLLLYTEFVSFWVYGLK